MRRSAHPFAASWARAPSARFARTAVVALVVAALVVAACASPGPPAPASAEAGGVQVLRRAKDVRITVGPQAGVDGIQVFVCPGVVTVGPGERPSAVAGSSDCVDLGIGSASEGLQVTFPFASLVPEEWALFSEARSWSVLVTESPDPDDRQGRHVIRTIEGGPLAGDPPPPPPNSP